MFPKIVFMIVITIILDGVRSQTTIEGETNTTDEEIFLIKLRMQNLDCHNSVRRQHLVMPLKGNQELDDEAQKWASSLATEDSVTYLNGSYGENIHSGVGELLNGFIPCNEWEDKHIDVPPVIEDPDPNYTYVPPMDEYTQMIWKSTEDVGFGYEKSESNYYVVCFYEPKGNNREEYDENVFEKNFPDRAYAIIPSSLLIFCEILSILCIN